MDAPTTLQPYPLRMKPFFRDYLWGGRKLGTLLGKPIPVEGIWAESWEVVEHSEHQSEITNGALAGQNLQQVAAEFGDWLMGEREGVSLPLLFKYLDCQKVLSVQVHPEDSYAQQMKTPDLGKTEAWYIISAEPGAKLYAGLKKGTTRQELATGISEGEVEKFLHVIEPQAGDCVFIPAGTVHALGAGLLVAEIQQASNTTFRLFDWNRVGVDGKPRALHVDQALEVIDFESGPRSVQKAEPTSQPGRSRLVACEKFTLDRLEGVSQVDMPSDSKFHLLTTPAGGVSLTWGNGEREVLAKGETVLLPAAMPDLICELNEGAFALDMYV